MDSYFDSDQSIRLLLQGGGDDGFGDGIGQPVELLLERRKAALQGFPCSQERAFPAFHAAA
jgi:hypothetical protein